MRSLRNDLTKTAFRTLNRFVVPLAKAGVFSPFPVGAGVVVLETTGRTSGLPREIPLLATRFGDRVTVSTVRTSSQWMRNLEADSAAGVWLHGRRREATASVSAGALSVARLDLC